LPNKFIKNLKMAAILIKRSNKISRLFRVKYSKPHIILLNIKNRIKYGPSAPKFAETIWVNPQDCSKYLALATFRKLFGFSRQEAKGRVIDTAWPIEHSRPIAEILLIRFCFDHWVKGIPWEETGAYERMEKLIKESDVGRSHGCTNRDDIVKRYENLDLIYEQAKREGRLRTNEEISPDYDWTAREMLIHIGPDGELFKGGEGMHRFAIASILGIPFPAQIGCVHVSAIPYLDNLRQNNFVNTSVIMNIKFCEDTNDRGLTGER
jgi:hypothetical protein